MKSPLRQPAQMSTGKSTQPPVSVPSARVPTGRMCAITVMRPVGEAAAAAPKVAAYAVGTTSAKPTTLPPFGSAAPAADGAKNLLASGPSAGSEPPGGACSSTSKPLTSISLRLTVVAVDDEIRLFTTTAATT